MTGKRIYSVRSACMLRCLTAGAAATMMSKSAFVLFSFVSVRVAFGAPTTRNVTCVWIKVLIALLPALFLARRNVNQRNIHTVACDSWKRERERVGKTWLTAVRRRWRGAYTSEIYFFRIMMPPFGWWQTRSFIGLWPAEERYAQNWLGMAWTNVEDRMKAFCLCIL